MYSENQRREIIAIATRDLSAAIRSGTPQQAASMRQRGITWTRRNPLDIHRRAQGNAL